MQFSERMGSAGRSQRPVIRRACSLGRREQYPERLSVESGTLGSFEAPVRDAEQLDEPFHVVWIPVE
jgi:hypothetical protein